jgi:hypothetical protein
MNASNKSGVLREENLNLLLIEKYGSMIHAWREYVMMHKDEETPMHIAMRRAASGDAWKHAMLSIETTASAVVPSVSVPVSTSTKVTLQNVKDAYVYSPHFVKIYALYPPKFRDTLMEDDVRIDYMIEVLSNIVA